jgi:hypothetical protein
MAILLVRVKGGILEINFHINMFFKENKMRKTFLIIFVMTVSFIANNTMSATNYKVAITQTPNSETFVNLMKAIADATKNTFDIQVAPAARVLNMIETNQVDMLCPATVNPNLKGNSSVKFDYSTVRLYKMAFVIYTNKNKQVDISELKKGNTKNFSIETTASLGELLEFKSQVTTSIESSLKKIETERVDGVIYSQSSGDALLKSLALKNIKRELYAYFEACIGIQKGKSGTDIDKMLSDGIAKLKANGKFDQLLASALRDGPFVNW